MKLVPWPCMLLKLVPRLCICVNYCRSAGATQDSEWSWYHGPLLQCSVGCKSYYKCLVGLPWPGKALVSSLSLSSSAFNLCVPVATNTSRRYLRSATHGDLLVPITRTVTYRPWSFAVSGPTVWNTFPSTLRVSTTTLRQFQSGVKTILFRLAYGTWLGTFVTV